MVVVLVLVSIGVLFGAQTVEGAEGARVLRVGDASLVEALLRSEEAQGLDARVLEEAGLVRLDAVEVPEWFVEEVLDPCSFGEGIATQDWRLVGLSCDEGDDEAWHAIACALGERGWAGYGADAESAKTFFKQEGRCRWMAISYAREGSATNIVLHIQHD